MVAPDLHAAVRPQRRLFWMFPLVLLLLLPLAGIAAEGASLRWSLPADAPPATRDAALAALAGELLDPPSDSSLTDVQRSQLLLVAGRPAQATAAIERLQQSFRDAGDPARAQRWVPYLLYAQARADTGDTLEVAYARAFRAQFARLDDLAALQTHYWFVTNLAGAQAELRDALAAQAGKSSITRDGALEVLRQAAFVQTYASTTNLAPSLIEEDEGRRFEIDDDVRIPAGDGVVLSAHMVRQRGVRAPQPAAMMFTIYTNPQKNRSQAALAAARGYVGVVVDARGKRDGTGQVAPYETEGEDANAAIDWISRQPWNDGQVVMYGGSYSGFAAWAAAKHAHPALKAIAPYVAAIPGLGLPMENNVFLSANYAWPFYVANTRLLDNDTYNQRSRWDALTENWYRSGRPYRQIDAVDGTPNPWLQRWLAHPDYDAYWQAMVPYGDDYARITIPVLSVTGYYDDGQISALEYFKQHTRRVPGADHRLLIGPYDHFGSQASVKAMELRGYAVDPVAQFDTQGITFEWFDHVLRGAPLPALLSDRVNYQLMGANRWEHAPSLDAAAGAYRAFHLTSARDGDRYRLSEQVPHQRDAISQTVDFADRSTQRHSYYPYPIMRDGAPTDGGLAFVSDAFPAPVDVVGSFSGDLKIRINKRDVDLTVTLYELMQDGRVMQLSYFVGRASYARDMTHRQLLTPGRWTTLPLQRTRMTGRQLAAGSRLLVIVDVLKDAQHQVNHGTGRDVSDESVADAGVPLKIDWHPDSLLRIPLREATP
ncbi:MAG: CocE/NonD family hydrolase [Stenotrophomonas sp.]|uniref:CocE/NonD family hydrolase n=1 Tax=Stenotrophomonas sp. TaxID=69392 RepID=UPI003D6CD42F